MELGVPDTKMAFLAYLTIVVALLSLLGRETRSWLRKANPQRELAVRAVALVAGLAAFVVGAVLMEGERGEELAVVASLAAGGALFVLGVILWRGRLALVLRASGWVLCVASLAVPSVLTLALPAAALLVVTLGTPPERDAPSRAQPARS